MTPFYTPSDVKAWETQIGQNLCFQHFAPQQNYKGFHVPNPLCERIFTIEKGLSVDKCLTQANEIEKTQSNLFNTIFNSIETGFEVGTISYELCSSLENNKELELVLSCFENAPKAKLIGKASLCQNVKQQSDIDFSYSCYTQQSHLITSDLQRARLCGQAKNFIELDSMLACIKKGIKGKNNAFIEETCANQVIQARKQ